MSSHLKVIERLLECPAHKELAAGNFVFYSCSRLHVHTEPLLDLTGNLIIVNNCSFKIMENVTEEPSIPTPLPLLATPLALMPNLHPSMKFATMFAHGTRRLWAGPFF